MVCAYWSANGRISANQLNSQRSNLFIIEEAIAYRRTEDGAIINAQQKSQQLLRDIVSSMSPADGWVLDACSGTGTIYLL